MAGGYEGNIENSDVINSIEFLY